MRTIKGSLLLTSIMALGIGPLSAESRSWAEKIYKAKYGRPSPTEDARLRAERADTAFRQVTPSQAEPSGVTWMRNYFKAKHGRNTPAEEARLKEARENSAFRQEPAPQATPAVWHDQRYKAKYGRAPGR